MAPLQLTPQGSAHRTYAYECPAKIYTSHESVNRGFQIVVGNSRRSIGDFLKGGVTEGGGFHTAVRGTMFVRNGAVTPGPSRECDITFFAKGRPKSAQQLRDSTVAARRAQSVTVPSSRVSRECRSPI